MNRVKVLICDDSQATHEAMSAYLKTEEMDFVSVYDGEAALHAFQKENFDIIILDIMMPKIFGTDVCKEIRKSSDVPIILLTAKGEEIDRIIGLEIGADDYIVKPFSPREIILRIKTILRRTHATAEKQETRLTFQDFVVDIGKYEVFIKNQKIDLTPKETEILFFLAKNSGTVFSREQLLDHIWGYDYFGDTRAVDTQIKRLRKKLPLEDLTFEIKSIYGVGYKFEVLT